MLIKSVILQNFRGYKERQEIEFSNLTAFVGKNDAGKSTVLEALDIFFNDGNGPISMDSKDVNVESQKETGGSNVDIIIGVEFNDLPDKVVIDENYETELKDEYLLNSRNNLTIIKKYPNGGKAKVYIYANHPSCKDCNDLLCKKQKELQKLTEALDCDHKKNAEMRKALWLSHKDELNLQMQEIDVTKEDAKNIWEKLKEYMPTYSLFQADRSNGDKDREVQDPLKEAVRRILRSSDIQQKCNEIYNSVMKELEEVSARTLGKINEMNSELASSLNPSMPTSDSLKWIDVFKNVSITGDEDIPLNKRGSGVRRMVLLNFFRAEVENVQKSKKNSSLIYAIEEPETAQHVEHQKMMMESLKNLSIIQNRQVIITTHSSTILKQLEFDNIRLVIDENKKKLVRYIEPAQLPYPSLNEIAFSAFAEVTEEYHDELYNHIQQCNLMTSYEVGKTKVAYYKNYKGRAITQYITMTEYIRHQIHHADNQLNDRYTKEQLVQSIINMRDFLCKSKVSLTK